MSVDSDLPDWTGHRERARCRLRSSPLQVAEFDDLFRDCVIAVDRADATSVRLTLDGGDEVAARVLVLTARETECCSFFTFELSPAPDGLRLLVQVPPGQVAVLDAFTTRAEQLGSTRSSDSALQPWPLGKVSKPGAAKTAAVDQTQPSTAASPSTHNEIWPG
jgi:hypothetical protein